MDIFVSFEAFSMTMDTWKMYDRSHYRKNSIRKILVKIDVTRK
jgi:hypothetical protein